MTGERAGVLSRATISAEAPDGARIPPPDLPVDAIQRHQQTMFEPALIVSPLLSLMRNQIEAADRFGLRAVTINSANRDDWAAIEHALAADC